MRKIIVGAFILAASLYGDCQFQSNSSKVSWKAFKTYEKIGVAGSFDRVTSQIIDANSIDALLMKSSIIIDTSSVNSGNPSRDATLVESFFKTQNVQSINANVKSAKDGKALVDITMNGILRTIPFSYTVNEDKIVGKGFIDLADFGMIPSLLSINKSCYTLHAGKTWQDVEIGFEIPLQKNCQ
ncbi:MAG: YceI family protein [Sulfuricurvum sp.]|nr:YceI family protein [Sulfuricurvum sp.]